MNGMTIEETIIVAKAIALAMGDRTVSLTELEKDTAFFMLKRIADQRTDLTEQQRELMKEIVDICKEATWARNL